MATAFEISRLGIEVNLPKGATYELLLVSTPEGYPKGQVSFKFESTPRKITGIQKVAQTFIRMLFTQKGSDLLYPTLGTNFPELVIGANRTSTDAQFRSEISTAILDAESQTKYIMNSATADLASQLSKVTIQGFETTIESLSLYIQVTTKAGETAAIAVPFPELDLLLTK
jgi:phage baseplate assembly protein W